MGDNALAKPTTQLQAYFAAHKSQIAAALPKHLNADRMCRLALTAFHQNKDLMACDPKSIFAGVVIASQMGLEIGVGGQGYLIPYKGKATFVPGWQGLVDLVSRAGRATVWTGAVFDGDEFDWALGDRPFVKHRPCGEDDPRKLIFTYAIGRVNGSEWPVVEVWSNARLRSHFKKFNKVGDKHYAHANWEMYGRKVPLLQVLKYMPKSIEVQNAIAVAEAAEEGRGATLDGNFVTIDEDPPGDEGGAGETGGSSGEQTAGEARGTEPKPYPADLFEQSFPLWKGLIESGKKTAADIIATASAKGELSEEQKKKLNDVKKGGEE